MVKVIHEAIGIEHGQITTIHDPTNTNVVVDAPNGIGAPKGLDPAITKKLRDAFRVAVASPEFKQVADRIDAPVLYLDGPDYEKYVASVYQKETVLIDKLKLKELMKS